MTNEREKRSKSALYIIIAVVAIASLAYRLLDRYSLEQTSLLFVGLPALIALLIVRYTGKPKSAYGVAFKAITLFLLIASIALGEGIICIIMAAPIFYGVTAILVAGYNWANKDKEEENILHTYILIPLVLILGQVTDFNKAPMLESVSVTKEVSATNFDGLKNEPDLNKDLALFFQMGFPKPVSIEGKGLEVGDTREMKFESTTKGIGSLVLEIKDITDTTLEFGVNSDDTHIAHWMTWKKVVISMEPIDEYTSNITWTSYYTCDLGPSWYFRPMERYAVGLSNEHLLQAFFE